MKKRGGRGRVGGRGSGGGREDQEEEEDEQEEEDEEENSHHNIPLCISCLPVFACLSTADGLTGVGGALLDGLGEGDLQKKDDDNGQFLVIAYFETM